MSVPVLSWRIKQSLNLNQTIVFLKSFLIKYNLILLLKKNKTNYPREIIPDLLTVNYNSYFLTCLLHSSLITLLLMILYYLSLSLSFFFFYVPYPFCKYKFSKQQVTLNQKQRQVKKIQIKQNDCSFCSFQKIFKFFKKLNIKVNLFQDIMYRLMKELLKLSIEKYSYTLN